MMEAGINRGRGNFNEVRELLLRKTSFSSGFRFFLT